MLTLMPTRTALDGEVKLLDAVSDAPERCLMGIWQSPQSLVAPNGFRRKHGIEAARLASAARGWPVSFRCTGGDVTPQGVGIANVTLSYALDSGQAPDIEATFDTLCAPIFQVLGPKTGYGFVDGAFCDGAYNITYAGLKFAGTAQRFRRCRADPDRIAVLSHAIFVLRPPRPEVFEAINHLLSDLNEDRVIQPQKHIGLPSNLSSDQFLKRIWQAYLSRFPNLERFDRRSRS